jgi:ribonuclease HII
LAGPVVVCATYIDARCKISNELKQKVKDSKKLSHNQRQDIVKEIRKIKGIEFVIEKSNEKEIDKINILNATLKAFKKAVIKLEKKINHKPGLVVIDGQ